MPFDDVDMDAAVSCVVCMKLTRVKPVIWPFLTVRLSLMHPHKVRAKMASGVNFFICI